MHDLDALRRTFLEDQAAVAREYAAALFVEMAGVRGVDYTRTPSATARFPQSKSLAEIGQLIGDGLACLFPPQKKKDAGQVYKPHHRVDHLVGTIAHEVLGQRAARPSNVRLTQSDELEGPPNAIDVRHARSVPERSGR